MIEHNHNPNIYLWEELQPTRFKTVWVLNLITYVGGVSYLGQSLNGIYSHFHIERPTNMSPHLAYIPTWE